MGRARMLGFLGKRAAAEEMAVKSRLRRSPFAVLLTSQGFRPDGGGTFCLNLVGDVLPGLPFP